tara:strand:- start:1397 stop:1705 length:309 start_codon:yes stop_codon:yes gene_type:complete
MAINSDKFCHLFSGFNLIVREKRTQTEVKRETKSTEESMDDIHELSPIQVERLLKKATEEYHMAKKLFNKGKITKDELYDCEWRVFELRTEIDRLNGNDRVV